MPRSQPRRNKVNREEDEKGPTTPFRQSVLDAVLKNGRQPVR